jgi:hypothetical protein
MKYQNSLLVSEDLDDRMGGSMKNLLFLKVENGDPINKRN